MKKPEIVGINRSACVATAATAIAILGPALAAEVISAAATCFLPGIAAFGSVAVLV